MTTTNPFLSDAERDRIARFLAKGYVIDPVADVAAFTRIQRETARLAAAHLGLPEAEQPQEFLDTLHQRVEPSRLNALRLAVFNQLNSQDWVRPAYYALARPILEAVVGNELVMQLRINLSIQLPHDDSSLLPIHADVWNGDSPYEVVVWLPLVDCARTKSMFIAPHDVNTAWHDRIATYAAQGAESLYRAVEPELEFLDIKAGEVLVFCQNQMHGNRINQESTTRWSMNCRFKSALSPYADKRLGEFFEPITLRPATRLGAAYHLPGGFGE